MFLPSAQTARYRHELIASPSMRTVHAPHSPTSKPFLTEVRWKLLRIISVRLARTSTICWRFGGFCAHGLRAAVPGEKTPAAREEIDSQVAVVLAALTDGTVDLVLEAFEFFAAENAVTRMVCRVKCCAVGTHETGKPRADNLAAGFHLKSTQDAVVIKGTALDDDVPS